MTETSENSNSVEQEKQNFIVEKFKEILDKKPAENFWVDEEEKVRAREEDVILALYEEGERVSSAVALEKGMRSISLMPEMKKPSFLFRNRSDIQQRGVKKTTAEQLRDIVEEQGKPTRILYVKTDWSNLGGTQKNNSFYGIFPFSEISEELGIE